MSEFYRRLAESIGARQAPDAGSFPVDARKVKAWVDALPRANPAATHKLLADALASLADRRHEGTPRLAALEVLRPAVLESIGALESQVQGSTIPLVPAKARAYEQLRAFESLLALNYRMAVVELCAPSGSVPFLRGGNVTTALARAMFHAGRLFMLAYFLYQPPAPGSWAAMHALEQFARVVRLEGKSVDDPAAGAGVTVESLYIQALLVAFTNPYRFSQKEQAELARIAGVLGSQLRLDASIGGGDVIGVPYTSDGGPGYIPAERVQSGEPLQWIDIAVARKAIDDRVDEGFGGTVRLQFKGGAAVDTSVDMLRRVRGGWGKASARRAMRLSAGHVLETVLGLGNIHFHLAGMQDFEAFAERAGQSGSHTEGERGGWSRIGVDAGRVPLARAEVVDQSLGGYQLRWPSDENAKARVGDLLGMCVPASDDERQWLLGVVRWMRFTHEGAVEAGVELLSRRLRPVALRPKGARDAATIQRGIEFEPARDAVEAGLRLAVPLNLDFSQVKVELLRVPDASDLDEPVSMQALIAGSRHLEDAGEYRLVEVELSE